MRTITVLIFATAILVLTGCTKERNESAQKNVLLPDRLVVISESVFGIPGDTGLQNMASIGNYNDAIIKKALRGELALHKPVFSYRGLPESETISADDLRAMFGRTGDNTGETLDSSVNACVREITSGLFMEEWILNENPFRLHKKVIAYQPVRHEPQYYNDPVTFLSQPTGDTSQVLLFSVLTDPPEEPGQVKSGREGLKLLAGNIQYEMNLYNRPYYEYLYTNENDVSETDVEQWASYNFNFYRYFDRDLFIDIIVDKVKSGEVKAYDPSEPERVLSEHEIYRNLQADTLLTPGDDEPGSKTWMIKKIMFVPSNYINSMVFIEDWYYSEASMGIIKIVRGVIPVLHNTLYDMDSNPSGIQKIPLFLVKFNKD